MERFPRLRTLSVFVVCFTACVSSDLYFPMNNMKLQIPADKHLERPLITLRALRHSGTLTPVNYTQSESQLFEHQLIGGQLVFTSLFAQMWNKTGSERVLVSARDVEGAEANTTVDISWEKPDRRPSYCDLFAEDLCFWRNVSYQLYENRDATKIGSLSSSYLADVCSGYKVVYTLINATDYLKIEKSLEENHWDIFTLKPFERDTHCHIRSDSPSGIGSSLFFNVKCMVLPPNSTEQFYQETLRLNVLDENDNVPRFDRDNIINLHLSKNLSLEEHLAQVNNMMFIDRDSVTVNNYTFKLLNDTRNLFKTECTQYPDDRHGEHQTALKCELLRKRDIRWLNDSYEVVFQINDTSLLPNNGESVENVTIRFLDSAPPTNLLYPEGTSISRSVALLGRVAAPYEWQKDEIKFKLKYDSTRRNRDFGAFNITVKEGIVFVRNVGILRQSVSPITLRIEWRNTTNNLTYEEIVLVNVTSDCWPDCKDELQHCSNFSSKKSCTKNCGLGTGGMNSNSTKCVWRGNTSNSSTTSYATCAPDEKTCPNQICDALEEQYYLLCPQDCTERLTGPEAIKNDNGRGIKKGLGACTCDDTYTCSCFFRTPREPRNKTLAASLKTTTEVTPHNSTNKSSVYIIGVVESNASAHTATDILTDLSSCGLPCLIGIGAASLFLLGAIMAVVVCWRYTHNGKDNQRRKYVENGSSINGVRSDYVDRTLNSTETLLLNFEMNSALAVEPVVPKIVPIVDPKWEFPREKLRIEQTLGEGEFGRVLRAKALEIAGLPGYTTVAVKTLKQDARDGELADLMSEYQLLKDVSHPNVIRLLGASTIPGGPVYLIIEFAEHGSLRNYLRRSRHLESEGRTPCSGALLGETEFPMLPACKISPHDILSFAWQISKGMSYLSDMKLVHRDLAARNVLVAAGMICKISDFGLTRDVYEDDTYLKRTKGRVPVKWMAPESLADHIYNTKSDVWSFGILLWELVTLGASPYPGIAVQNLFHLLRTGFRMERSDNCSPTLYKIMRSCWNEEPVERPSFRSLTLKLETMLADGIDYLDLNPRVVHNRTYFTSLSDSANTPDEIEEAIKFGTRTIPEPNAINLLSQTENSTKCAEVDKIQVLWKRPESPKPSNTKTYENEAQAHEMNHYESPIKLRNKADGLQTPTNERPQSYIDMAGPSNRDTQTLLATKCKEEIEEISKVTSL